MLNTIREIVALNKDNQLIRSVLLNTNRNQLYKKDKVIKKYY